MSRYISEITNKLPGLDEHKKKDLASRLYNIDNEITDKFAKSFSLSGLLSLLTTEFYGITRIDSGDMWGWGYIGLAAIFGTVSGLLNVSYYDKVRKKSKEKLYSEYK